MKSTAVDLATIEACIPLYAVGLLHCCAFIMGRLYCLSVCARFHVKLGHIHGIMATVSENQIKEALGKRKHDIADNLE